MEWPIEIHVHNLLERIELLEKRIMSGLTDLQAAVVANTTATNAAVAALQASASGDSDAAVEAAAQTIIANNTALTNAVAALTSASAQPAA
jgi:hypothetical protein